MGCSAPSSSLPRRSWSSRSRTSSSICRSRAWSRWRSMRWCVRRRSRGPAGRCPRHRLGVGMLTKPTFATYVLPAMVRMARLARPIADAGWRGSARSLRSRRPRREGTDRLIDFRAGAQSLVQAGRRGRTGRSADAGSLSIRGSSCPSSDRSPGCSARGRLGASEGPRARAFLAQPARALRALFTDPEQNLRYTLPSLAAALVTAVGVSSRSWKWGAIGVVWQWARCRSR